MPFTGQLGTVNSKPGNIVPGFGASSLPYHLFSGLYTIVDGKPNDTLFLTINYPNFTVINTTIPNPFVETALVSEGDINK